MSCISDPGMGSVCKERKDCLCPTPTEEDQHLDCIKEDGATADDTGICDCMPGYYFKTLSGRCINCKYIVCLSTISN